MPDITIAQVITATPTITYTLPISQYIQMFQPLVIAQPAELTTTVPYTFQIINMFTSSGPYGATIVSWFFDHSVIDYYIWLRLAFVALLFLIAFVMRRIKAGRDSAVTVIQQIRGYGQK